MPFPDGASAFVKRANVAATDAIKGNGVSFMENATDAAIQSNSRQRSRSSILRSEPGVDGARGVTTHEPDARSETEAWYASVAQRTPVDRQAVLNPEVVFQNLSCDTGVFAALRVMNLDAKRARVLDVGCAGGASLLNLLRIGCVSDNLTGVDILPQQIALGRARLPGVHFTCADASKMAYADETFDLTLESTMFVQLTDEDLSARIAAEMIRVTKVGGHVMLIDWRMGKPWDKSYKALSRRRIAALFNVPSKTQLVAQFPGALVPPLGRLLSKHAPSLYFPVRALVPFLAAQAVTVLRRTA